MKGNKFVEPERNRVPAPDLVTGWPLAIGALFSVSVVFASVTQIYLPFPPVMTVEDPDARLIVKSVVPASISALTARLVEEPSSRLSDEFCGAILSVPEVTPAVSVCVAVGLNSVTLVDVAVCKVVLVEAVKLGATATMPLAPYPAHSVPLTVAQPIVVSDPEVFESKPVVVPVNTLVKVIRGLFPAEPRVPVPAPTKFTVILVESRSEPVSVKLSCAPVPPLLVTLIARAPSLNVTDPRVSEVPALLPIKEKVPPTALKVAVFERRPAAAEVLPAVLSITNDPPRVETDVAPATPLVESPVPVSLRVAPLLMP